MGSGYWDDDRYRRSTSGSAAFSYDRSIRSQPRSEWRPDQQLDPFGLNVRESRDSDDHPKSNAVIVGLDVTGSMTNVVVIIRDALGNLMNLLLNGRYIDDPQLLFGAVGDATCDTVPFQVSQFESDIKINDQLTKVVLEGGGGGQNTESYELAFYLAARHTSIDCWEKRQQKGYLFTIGDEMPYEAVNRVEVKRLFNASLSENIPTRDIVREAQQKYYTFHIIPKGSSRYGDQQVYSKWVEVLGGKQFVLTLDDPAAICEMIALAIGLNEGKINFEEGLREITNRVGQQTAAVVQRALQNFAQVVRPVAVVDEPVDDKDKSSKLEGRPGGKKKKKLGGL